MQRQPNFTVQGTHSKAIFIACDNYSDAAYLNLVSLNKNIPNRVETKATVNDTREYVKTSITLGTLQLINI